MKPYLKNNRTGKVEKGAVRQLHEHDLEEIMRVQQLAASTLEDSSVYVASNRAEVLTMLNDGEMQGMFADGKLCGVCGILRCTDDPTLADELDFDSQQKEKALNLECYFVLPDYRGNGIARELARLCLDRAQQRFGARCLLASVSPKNLASLMTMMSINGFRIRALRQLYGCKLRYILCCDPSSERLYTYYERFAVEDVYAISRALTQGYEGIATFTNADGSFVWLAK